jgi:hypothetical protein
MIYEYKCNKCGHVSEVDLDPNMPLPKLIHCTKKSCKGFMSRVWMINPIVPEHMKATSDNSINYEKSNQIHKTHFGPAGRF